MGNESEFHLRKKPETQHGNPEEHGAWTEQVRSSYEQAASNTSDRENSQDLGDRLPNPWDVNIVRDRLRRRWLKSKFGKREFLRKRKRYELLGLGHPSTIVPDPQRFSEALQQVTEHYRQARKSDVHARRRGSLRVR